jgi:hypothetical protein
VAAIRSLPPGDKDRLARRHGTLCPHDYRKIILIMESRMRLPRLIGVVVVALLATSCSDSTAPPRRVTALFALESVNGQPLPTTFSSGTWTFSIYSETIRLDDAGTATISENRREVSGTYQRDINAALQVPYEIRGDRITLGFPCGNGPLDDCAPNRSGLITGSTLTLTPFRNAEGSVTYSYSQSLRN